MKTTAAALLSILAAGMLLTACASDGEMWGHHHDHDHDGDHHDGDHHDQHLVGALSQPSGPAAPVIVGR